MKSNSLSSIFIAGPLLLSGISISAIEVRSNSDSRWLDIYFNNDSIQWVRSYMLNDYPTLEFETSNLTGEDGSILYDHFKISSSTSEPSDVDIDDLENIGVGHHVLRLHIDTDKAMNDITSKSKYEHGRLSVESDFGSENIVNIPMNIRGRGNTSWRWPKKPYRLKFDYKVSLPGLRPAKNFVLLANYIDDTLLRNSVAFEAGRLLGMPFNFSSIPVDVYFNGIYKGAYQLTEKIAIGNQLVDIDKYKGILWELAARPQGEEGYIYTTPGYQMYLSVKDPDFAEVAYANKMTPEELFLIWQEDYNEIENHVINGIPWEVIDLDDFVNYIIVQNLSCNYDFSFPFSVFAYKNDITDKLHFGPLWDFDKGFNYSQFNTPHRHLIYMTTPGALMFTDMIRHPDFVKAYDKKWREFTEMHLPKLLEYIDSQAQIIKASALADGQTYPNSTNYDNMERLSCETFDKSVEMLKEWIIEQAELISNDPSFLLLKNEDLRSEIELIEE
ncbi:MAG: hypothetical protein HDS67_00185 [Bacteroidales bacterium]|nr:hypothetical protein [Bacteroidales bacterium]